jgi:hypothetical protein
MSVPDSSGAPAAEAGPEMPDAGPEYKDWSRENRESQVPIRRASEMSEVLTGIRKDFGHQADMITVRKRVLTGRSPGQRKDQLRDSRRTAYQVCIPRIS